MRLRLRHIPSASFLFGLLCFFLPFITLSCPGSSVTLSGTQIATGTTVEVPQMFGGVVERKLDREPVALLALLCILTGCALGLSPARVAHLVAAALGLLATLLLFMLKAKITSDVLREGEGMLAVSYGAGYWLALVSALFAALSSFALVKMRVKVVAEPREREEVLGDPNKIGYPQ